MLHFFYFHFLEYASMHKNASGLLGRKICSKIKLSAPDLIVSTHAHLNHGYFELSRLSSEKQSPFVVYCGELADGQGFSRHWINPKNDLFVSPFEEGNLAARMRGMLPGKTLVAGPLLRKPFYRGNHRFDRSEVIKDLGLDPRLPIYLLGTGANGVNHHIPVIKATNQAQIDCQILALCGWNVKTHRLIQNLHRQVATWWCHLPISRPNQSSTCSRFLHGCWPDLVPV